MSDWKQIGDFAKVRRGASPRPIDDPKWFGGDVGWVRIIDVTRSKRYLRSTEQYLSPLGEANSVRVDKGDLIMSICATIGRPVIVDMPACIHANGFVQFYDIQGADTEYLYYALQHAEQEFLSYGQTGTQANLNTTIVGRHVLFVPRHPEQRKIAKVLTTVDNLIEKTEALIAKYQSVKQGLMHDLFTRGVDEHGHLRPPYAEAPELYNESELGWIPREWGVTRVGDVFEIQLGKMLSRASKTGCYSFPYLANRNVQWDRVDLSDLETMDFLDSERGKFSLLPGDLLVCEGGEVGRTAMWRGEVDCCYFQKAIHRLRPRTPNVSPIFMLRFMRYAANVGWFTDFTSQSSIAHLTREKLAEVSLLLPSPEEQEAIRERFDAVDKRLNVERSYWSKLSKLKTALMQDLLTGKVRVKVDEATDV